MTAVINTVSRDNSMSSSRREHCYNWHNRAAVTLMAGIVAMGAGIPNVLAQQCEGVFPEVVSICPTYDGQGACNCGQNVATGECNTCVYIQFSSCKDPSVCVFYCSQAQCHNDEQLPEPTCSGSCPCLLMT